jgi:NAD+ synthase
MVMSTTEEASADMDAERITDQIIKFIRRQVSSAGVDGVVIGLSGGVDSSLAASLCVRALGKERVLGLLMPTDFTPEEDIQDARALAEKLQIQTHTIRMDGIVKAFATEMPIDTESEAAKIPMANLLARARMVVLYFFANRENLLVAGTGDRSEALIGYFTKYGDGAVDFHPISHLYKNQVRELAGHLGVPARISEKPSSPQLYPDHEAEEEIPLPYTRLDEVLHCIFDRGLSVEETAEICSVSQETVEDVLLRYEDTSHKRESPPMVRPDLLVR